MKKIVVSGGYGFIGSNLIKYLLKKLDPKLIIEVVGYNRLVKHINIVANDLNIPTVELQHSYISKSHIAYNYPDNIGLVQAFPQNLSIWASFHINQMNLPINKNNILKQHRWHFP